MQGIISILLYLLEADLLTNMWSVLEKDPFGAEKDVYSPVRLSTVDIY